MYIIQQDFSNTSKTCIQFFLFGSFCCRGSHLIIKCIFSGIFVNNWFSWFMEYQKLLYLGIIRLRKRIIVFFFRINNVFGSSTCWAHGPFLGIRIWTSVSIILQFTCAIINYFSMLVVWFQVEYYENSLKKHELSFLWRCISFIYMKFVS